MKKTNLIRLLILLLCFAMVAATVTGCKKDNKDASSDTSDSVLYNDDLDDEDEDDVLVDDEDDVVNNKGTSSGKKNKTGGGGATGSGALATGEKVETYKSDEKATKTFFETVPAHLKGKTVKVLVWWDPGSGDSVKERVFKAKTGISVKWINSGLGNHTTKLASMIGQGNAPDIAPLLQVDYPTSIINNYFQPITVAKYDLTDPIFDIDSMKQYQWNGKMYGVLPKSNSMIDFYPVFYNVNMFQKYGIKTPTELWKANNWNWDTFLDTCAQFKSKGIAAPVSGDYGCVYLHASCGEDCVVTDKSGRFVNNCGSAKVLAGWQFLAKLSSTYKYTSAYNNFWGQQTPLLVTANYIAQSGDMLDKNANFTWDMVPAPAPKGEKTVMFGSIKMWGFPRGAKNVEAASYWLRYWLDCTLDDPSSPTWTTKNTNCDTLAMISWMWNQPKSFFNYRSVVNYGGNYTSESMDAELMSCGEANVKTVLDKWSGVITSNIKAINSLS